MTAYNLLSRLSITMSVAIFCAAVFFVASTSFTAAQELSGTESLFCEIDTPITVKLTNTNPVTVEDRLSNAIIVENKSDKHIGGLSVAVGVFSENELTHIYVAETDKSVSPYSRESTIFAADVTVLPVGEYTYKVVAEQGGISSVISELMLSDERDLISLTKTGDAVEQLQTLININGSLSSADEVLQLEQSEKISVTSTATNISPLPLFEAHIDILLSESDVPFGDAVITHVHDEAKLFPGSKRQTSSDGNTVLAGPHSVYVVQHIPDTLMPLHRRDIQVGSIESHGYATRMSHVGVGDRVGETELEVAVCLEELRSGETYRDRVDSVAIQLSQSGTDFSSEILNNIDNVVEVIATMPVLADDVSANVALLAASSNSGTEGPLFTKQTINFGFDCERHDVCEARVVEAVADFAQTEAAQTSLWFYGGITVAALLTLLLVVRRMKVEPKEEVKMHLPEDDA